MDNDLIKILLVDDDDDDHVITRNLLSEIEGWHFDLEWVDTYDVALERIRQQEHDVYLLDYRLGARTGLDLLRESLELGCEAPMILLTGQGDREVDLEATKAGAQDYLNKNNMNSTSLERSIRYAIERHKKKLKRSIRYAIERRKKQANQPQESH